MTYNYWYDGRSCSWWQSQVLELFWWNPAIQKSVTNHVFYQLQFASLMDVQRNNLKHWFIEEMCLALTTFRSYLWYKITSGGRVVTIICYQYFLTWRNKCDLLFYWQLNISAFCLENSRKKGCCFVFVFWLLSHKFWHSKDTLWIWFDSTV